MNKGMTRLIAIVLALMLALGMSALAAETKSDAFRVSGATERPEDSATEEAQTGNEMPTAPDVTKEPVEIPAEPIGQKQVCLNSAEDSVKIFEAADGAAAVIGNAFHGDVVDVYVVDGAWTLIKMGGTMGWVASAHLKEVGAAETPEPTATPEPTPEPTPVPVPEEAIGQKQVCLNNASDSVSVFEAADGASAVVGSLSHGDVVDVYVEAGAWTLVRANGLEGWIASGHLKAVGSAEPEAAPEPEVTEEPAEPEATPEPEATEEPAEPEATSEPEATEEPAEPEATVEPEATEAPEEVPTFEYERDEDGNLVLDENGDPIPVIPEDATQKPVAYQRDENGELVLDENGNPIPVQYLPVEAEKINSLEDAVNPNGRIDIYVNWVDDAARGYGEEAKLTAVLTGYDNLVYSIQWLVSKDGVNYNDVPGATGMEYVTEVTPENVNDIWSVELTITDVIE